MQTIPYTTPEGIIELVRKDEHDAVVRELNAAKAALSGRTVSCSNCNEAASKRCDWKEDEDGNWDTNCGQCMCFEYAPPNEQGYKFCHHCAATINFIKYTQSLP